LHRFLPGTPYPEIGDCLASMFAKPPLSKAILVVDQTGLAKLSILIPKIW